MKMRASILPCLLLALLAACGRAPPPAAPAQAESSEAHHDDAPASTVIAPKVAAASGIEVAAAAPGVIADEHEIQGLLTPVEGRVAKVTARFPGPIRSLRAGVGDAVRAGEPLATIESNLSLTPYTIRAPIGGVVLERGASVGSVAGEGTPLYEIADLSELWVDLHVFGADAQHIRAGTAVVVTRMDDGAIAETKLERILPATASASQSTIARATLRNDDGRWRPGTAVRARVTVDRQPVAIALPLGALQTVDADDVVYVREGDTYSTRVVKLGRRDAQRVEILAGVEAGEQVVVVQSFLVKADIGKSSAEHED